MSGLNPRACRMNVSRSGPCFRPQSACISDKCSLLSKGLRGGMSRSDRVVSLLRRMIASEDAKNPLKARKQLGSTRIWPCYIRLKDGDYRVESGEFAETQVQRPPEQKSSIPRAYRVIKFVARRWQSVAMSPPHACLLVLEPAPPRWIRLEEFSSCDLWRPRKTCFWCSRLLG